MSTIFEVIPTKNDKVTFGNVLKRAEDTIHSFFIELGIKIRISFQATVISGDSRDDAVYFSEFKWSENSYAWISIANFPGGTDVYCDRISDKNDDIDVWWYFDELRHAPAYRPEYDDAFHRARSIDKKWRFRRSAGQPAIVSLCYGHLAAAIAELTDGFIFSGDGAWEYDLFPCSAQQLLASYFRPDLESTSDHVEWGSRCIDDIRNRL